MSGSENINQSDSEIPLSSRPRPVVFLLLDGLGIAPLTEANAIASANTPVWKKLLEEYPASLLTATGKDLNLRYLRIGTGCDLVDGNIGKIESLSSVLSAAGLKQVKVAETERFAALTHFFNGCNEEKMTGEEWKIISSETGDRSVKPMLSLKRVVNEIIKLINSDEPVDFIAASIPILDLVASSGEFSPVVRAVEELDKALKKIIAEIIVQDGVLVISSAGGNAEKMIDLSTEMANREMTDNPVPVVIVGEEFIGKVIGSTDTVGDDLSLSSPSGTLKIIAFFAK